MSNVFFVADRHCQTIAPFSFPWVCGKYFNMVSQLSAPPAPVTPCEWFPTQPWSPSRALNHRPLSAQHLQSAAQQTLRAPGNACAHWFFLLCLPSLLLACSPYVAEVQHLPCWPCLHSACSPHLSVCFSLFSISLFFSSLFSLSFREGNSSYCFFLCMTLILLNLEQSNLTKI